jgi:hypothetical protein
VPPSSICDACRLHVYLDGYNLALQQGTGMAAYARNLSFALRDLGAEVGVLYGTRVPRSSRNALIREIAFFDPAVGQPNRVVRWIRSAQRVLATAFGEVATQVPLTGQVVSRQF